MKTITTFSPEKVEAMGAVTNIAGVVGVLGCSGTYARRLCEQGKLKAVKLGSHWRVNTKSLLEYAGLA